MCPLVGDSYPTPNTIAGGQLHGIADKVADLVAAVLVADKEAWISINPIPEVT